MTEIKHNDPFDNWNIFWLATTLLTVVALLIQLQIERTNFKADSLIILSLGIPLSEQHT